MTTVRGPGNPMEPMGGDQTSSTGNVQGQSGGHSFSVQSGKPNSILNNKTADDLNRLTAEMKTHKFTVGNPFSKAFNTVKNLISKIFSKSPQVETRGVRSNAQLYPESRVTQAASPITQPLSREKQAENLRKVMDERIVKTTTSLKDSSKSLIKNDNEQFLQNQRSLNAAASEARNALNEWKNQEVGPPFNLDKAMSRFNEAARNWEADNLLADNNQ